MSCGGIDIDATTKRKKNTKRSSKFRLAVIQFRNIDVAENDVRVAGGNWINNNIRKFILAFEDGRDMVTDSLEVYLLSLILFLDFGNLTIFIKRTSVNISFKRADYLSWNGCFVVSCSSTSYSKRLLLLQFLGQLRGS